MVASSTLSKLAIKRRIRTPLIAFCDLFPAHIVVHCDDLWL